MYINENGYYVKNGRLLHRTIYENFHNVSLNTETIVHHKDGDKLNNCIYNLEAMSNSDHNKLHNGLLGFKYFFTLYDLVDCKKNGLKLYQASMKLGCTKTIISSSLKQIGLNYRNLHKISFDEIVDKQEYVYNQLDKKP